MGQSSQSNQHGPPVAAKGFTALLNYIFRGHKSPPHFVHISVRKYNGIFPTKFASKKYKAVEVRKIVIGHVTCSGRNQARKSGENHYSFSILFWFALRHHFLWKKMKPYLMLVGDRLCHYFYKKDQKILRCQIDFLIICNFF